MHSSKPNSTSIEFSDYQTSIPSILDRIGAADVLAAQNHILLKPNLVNASPPPVTTPTDCCEAIIDFIRSVSDSRITIAEGCGDVCRETPEIFSCLGYDRLSARYGVDLTDLNAQPLVRKENPACSLFQEIFLPEIAFTTFIISIPVLKAHSLAGITGALKNMMG
ncbi:MAG: DUF362 domain-containing protein, partial [Desulfovibrionales bacterium]